MIWFADDTGMSIENEAKQPNVLLYGGIAISLAELEKLKSLIRKIKKNYTHENMPIKWNMRDLRETYKEFDRAEEFDRITKESSIWRKELFEEAAKIDYKIIASVIRNKYLDRDKKYDDITTGFCFSNALMRVALLLEKEKGPHQVILDWPKANDPKAFNREYYYAYNNGSDSTKKNKFYSGPLKNIGFNESLLFAKSTHSVGLQFADLVIGATKDYLNSIQDDRTESHGLDAMKLIKTKFNGYPNDILGRGIIFQGGNSRDRTLSKIKTVLSIDL